MGKKSFSRWTRGRLIREWRAALLLAVLLSTGWLVRAETVVVHQERWRWSNPLPHGNNVLDMVLDSDVSMQVGDGGTVYVRQFDSRWAPADSGVTNYLRGAALMGPRLLATGAGGCILWSDDGRQFSPAQVQPATSDWFEGVAASSQRAVAVGDYGAVYSSSDGTNWNRAVSGTVEWLRGAAFGNGAFVAVGENGTILRSNNGTSWSSIGSGTSEDLNRVRYVGSGTNARFVAVGSQGVMLSSTTGLAPWTLLPTGTTNTLYDVALNDQGMLAVGDQEIRFQAAGETIWVDQINGLSSNAPPPWVYLSAGTESNNWMVAGWTGLLVESAGNPGIGYSWNTFEESSHAWIWDVTVQKGICVAVGDLARIQTSLDGILWAREVVPVAYTNTVFLGVGGTSNLLIAAGTGGAVLISHAGTASIPVTNTVDNAPVITNQLVEALGVLWTNVPSFTTNSLQGVAASDGLYLACGDNGCMFASTNGTDWVARSTPATGFLTGVAIGPAACVAVGANGTLLRSDPDGLDWSVVSMNTGNWIYRVRWLDDQFVAVGQNGSIYTSPDGSAWMVRTSGTARWLTDVTRVEDRWFVSGYQGTLLTSSNLVDWSRLPVPTVKSLFAAGHLDGRLIIAGIEGIILRNQVVPLATPVNILAYQPSVVEESDMSRTLYEVFLLGGVADQFYAFQSTTNLMDETWNELGPFELFDRSGTAYILRSSNLSEAPQEECYRTRIMP